jgi:hypothetical protein
MQVRLLTPLIHCIHTLHSFTALIPTALIFTALIHCTHSLHSYSLHSYTALTHCTHTLHSYTALIFTALTHCTHTLYSYTALTHSTHTLYSYTALTHCTHTLHSYPLYSYSVLIHCTHTHYTHCTPCTHTLHLLQASTRWRAAIDSASRVHAWCECASMQLLVFCTIQCPFDTTYLSAAGRCLLCTCIPTVHMHTYCAHALMHPVLPHCTPILYSRILHSHTALTRAAPSYTAPSYTAPSYTAPSYTAPSHIPPAQCHDLTAGQWERSVNPPLGAQRQGMMRLIIYSLCTYSTLTLHPLCTRSTPTLHRQADGVYSGGAVPEAKRSGAQRQWLLLVQVLSTDCSY